MIHFVQPRAPEPSPPAEHESPPEPPSRPRPRDDAPDAGQPFDPDATLNDLPPARRPQREARA